MTQLGCVADGGRGRGRVACVLLCVYRAEVCECVFAHAFVFVHVSRIMHLPGVNEPDVGGGEIRFLLHVTQIFFIINWKYL